MVCRDTDGNSGMTSFSRFNSGIADVQVLSLFHEQRAAAPADGVDPSGAESNTFIDHIAERVRNDTSLSPARRIHMLRRFGRAHLERVDARTYYAWATIEERSLRARLALDTHFDEVANQHDSTREVVAARFATLVNERPPGLAGRPPYTPTFDRTGLPTDDGTIYAMQLLYLLGPHDAGSAERRAFCVRGWERTDATQEANDRAAGIAPMSASQRRAASRAASAGNGGGRAQNCPECGQFMAAGHTCDLSAVAASVAPAHVEPVPMQRVPNTGNAAADEPVTPEPVAVSEPVAAPSAPVRRERQRTANRSYNIGTGTVRMTNLSQVRAAARGGVTTESIIAEVDTAGLSHNGLSQERYWVRGTVEITDTGNRRSATRDRLTVSSSERSLQCGCDEYRQNYTCEHVVGACAQVQALLNNRDAVATVPAEVAAEVREELREGYQESLGTQQALRAQMGTTDDGVKYSGNMDAFQEAWDEAKERKASGDSALPYMTENAMNGLSTPETGFSIGLEFEIDFPDCERDRYGNYPAKQRVAQEMYDAGLSRNSVAQGWHHGARIAGGYTTDTDAWNVEYDRTVDGVEGARGCEIVSPIMYDTPQTWEAVAKITEIVNRNGGTCTQRTGLHVNVGASAFNHTVERHNALLSSVSRYEDVLIRSGTNPESGRTHRGREYCTPLTVPASGFRSIGEAQRSNGHRAMVNLDHVPNESGRITNSTRVEMRHFDGSMDNGRIQANAKVAVALAAAAARGAAASTTSEPAGSHRRANVNANGRMPLLTGDAWTEDMKSVCEVADYLYTREADKRQFISTIQGTTWQAR